jgi:hypothetical protein
MLLSCLLGGALYVAAAYLAALLPFLHRCPTRSLRPLAAPVLRVARWFADDGGRIAERLHPPPACTPWVAPSGSFVFKEGIFLAPAPLPPPSPPPHIHQNTPCSFATLDFLHQCTVGFSGVLFTLLLVDSSLNSAPRRWVGMGGEGKGARL